MLFVWARPNGYVAIGLPYFLKGDVVKTKPVKVEIVRADKVIFDGQWITNGCWAISVDPSVSTITCKNKKMRDVVMPRIGGHQPFVFLGGDTPIDNSKHRMVKMLQKLASDVGDKRAPLVLATKLCYDWSRRQQRADNTWEHIDAQARLLHTADDKEFVLLDERYSKMFIGLEMRKPDKTGALSLWNEIGLVGIALPIRCTSEDGDSIFNTIISTGKQVSYFFEKVKATRKW